MRGASTLSRVVTALLVLGASAGVSGNGNGVALRLHGAIEPVRSHPVVVPRLAGSNTGTLVIVHLVKPGTQVKKGQVLCIIEAMKLMNEIDSEYDGEIVNVYVESGQPVQYGERLFAIRTR